MYLRFIVVAPVKWRESRIGVDCKHLNNKLMLLNIGLLVPFLKTNTIGRC